MAMATTFNDLVQPSKPFGWAPRGLLSRISDVSKNLTNKAIELGNIDITLGKTVSVLSNAVKSIFKKPSKEDALWMGLTVAAGIGAKLATFSVLNIASGGTVTAALIGGAAVGVTKSVINSYRESKKEDGLSFTKSFFSTKTLMTTVSGTALSAATFGALGAIESATGVNISEKIGQGLHHAFNAAAKFGKAAGEFAFNHIPIGAQAATLKVPMGTQVATAAAPAAHPAPQAVSGRPAVSGSHQPQRVTSVKPTLEPVSTAYKTEYAIERLRTLLIEAGEVPKDNATALELAKQFAPNTQNPDSLVRALESRAPQPVIQPNTAPTAQPKPDVKSVAIPQPKPIVVKVGETEITMPNQPNLDEEFNLAQAGVTDGKILDKKELALSCVTQFANSQEALAAQGGILPTTCTPQQTEVKKGMFATLRNLFSGKTTIIGFEGDIPKPTTEFITDIARDVIPHLSERQLSLTPATLR